MAEIIDTRSSDGYLVVLGNGLTLPSSGASTTPFAGSLRYNPNTQTVQLYTTSWNNLAGGGSGSGLATVTLTGDATGVTNAQGTLPVTLQTISGLTAGTYSNVSIDVKGRIKTARALNASDISIALTYTPANIASPTFTGTPSAPTPATTDNSTKIATTSYVQSNIFKTVLNGSTTFYVSSSGSDSNPGTQTNPYATVTHAYSQLVNRYNLNGQNVTIQVQNGAYTEAVVIAGVPEGFGSNSISIVGNNSTPTSVSFAPTNGSAISVLNGATVSISGFLVTSSTSCGLFLQNNATVNVGTINFGACPNGFHIQGGGTGSYIFLNSPYTISGNALSHYLCGGGGEIVLYTTANPVTVALSGGGTMSFSQGFANALTSANIEVFPGVSFSVTGGTTVNALKSNARLNGTINTNGQGGANYFPGNITGTYASGGEYA